MIDKNDYKLYIYTRGGILVSEDCITGNFMLYRKVNDNYQALSIGKSVTFTCSFNIINFAQYGKLIPEYKTYPTNLDKSADHDSIDFNLKEFKNTGDFNTFMKKSIEQILIKRRVLEELSM